ncbi:MAG TPA: hypothetical protein VKV24_03325 [Casimicrobiaceae bacterium]|nr:hypothetical protein [Casimicrobiaceae bacterium]
MRIDHGIAARAAPIFRSFWIAGFDGTDHLAGLHGRPDADSYRSHVLPDYRRASDAGIRCVRENVGWRHASSGGALDFETANGCTPSARRSAMRSSGAPR